MNSITRLVIAAMHVCRLQLGFWRASVCLFEETCTRYSTRQLEQHILPWALLKILFRVASCNPITGIMRYMIKKYSYRAYRARRDFVVPQDERD